MGVCDNLALERALLSQGHTLIAGVDEVGRGCLAGPLVAAAVILPLERPDLTSLLEGVRDSKLLTAAARRSAFDAIRSVASGIGIGWASHQCIDREGVAAANRRAMHRAVMALLCYPDHLLLDYVRLTECPLPQLSLPKGETHSLSIAAASIVAKVVRDRWMERAARLYPQYGFERNKGYGTAEHRAALALHGPCRLHRRSFAPVASLDVV